jgi:hypothetical protein
MYYVLAAIFFIVVYFAFAKLLSSILKGCLVTAGVFILLLTSYVLLKSSVEPVILFDRYKIKNFRIEEIKKPREILGSWEYF